MSGIQLTKLQQFKATWIGRKYKCKDTGVIVELTEEMVWPRAFIQIGDGAIDLGDGFYSRRLGNIEEIKT